MSDSWDEPDEDNEFDSEESDLIQCSECGSEIYEDSVACPVCGEYVIADTNIWSGRPVWWIVLGVAGMIATVVALSFAVF